MKNMDWDSIKIAGLLSVALLLSTGFGAALRSPAEPALLPSAAAVPERVQTYRMAVSMQTAEGAFTCTTNWSTITATNQLAFTWDAATNCGTMGGATNWILFWGLTNQANVWTTNLGATIKTQYFTVLTNAPYLRLDTLPLPPTNWIFTIYGSLDLTNWYTITNIFIPNCKPFEFMKVGLIPVVR